MSYLIEDYLKDIQEFEIGYVGKYRNMLTQAIKDLGKDPKKYSYIRATRGEFETGRAIAAGIAAAVIIALSIKMFRKYLTKVGKQCRNFKTGSQRYKACGAEVKVDARKEQIKLLNNKINLCKGSKEPSKCVSKVKEKISEVNEKIKQLQSKKRVYMQKAKLSGRL